VLGDAKDRDKLRHVFERYEPAIVFHAAAYKHVPLLEANPLESVRNNVITTKVMAEVAVEFGVTLVGFLRGRRANVYSAGHRLGVAATAVP
jgi:FlaA1/EpsC-like NDP-sugar epimerase